MGEGRGNPELETLREKQIQAFLGGRGADKWVKNTIYNRSQPQIYLACSI